MAARERAEEGERSETERGTGEREGGRKGGRERERERETSIERVIGLERVPVARMHVKARARRGEHRVIEHDRPGRAIFGFLFVDVICFAKTKVDVLVLS